MALFTSSALPKISLCALLAVVSRLSIVRGWDPQPDGYEVITGPKGPDDLSQWHMEWNLWKKMELKRTRYDGSDSCVVYNRLSSQWTQRNFVQLFVMLSDRKFYDRESGKFLVEEYVKGMEKEIGKIDSVLLWPSYPNLGIDNRNQWDFLRFSDSRSSEWDVLKDVVQRFHAMNKRVILPYNPWDQNTRSEDGLADSVRMYLADIKVLTELIQYTGADGFNGDTMYGVPKSFYTCSNDKDGKGNEPLIATPEGGVPTAYIGFNPMSWGYYGFDPVPPVSMPKFLESRHLVQVCNRWSRNRVEEIQMAFFNGVGYVVWENIWGTFHSNSDLEKEAIKRAFSILRHFADFTTSPDWKPHAFLFRKEDVQVSVSEFPLQQRNMVFYTIVSYSWTEVSGFPKANSTEIESIDRDYITVHFPLRDGEALLKSEVLVYDAYYGRELQVQHADVNKNGVSSGDRFVALRIERSAFSAILLVSKSGSDNSEFLSDLPSYLNNMQTMTKKLLKSYATEHPLAPQTLSIPPNQAQTGTDTSTMVLITGASNYWFNVSGVQIEPVAAWTPQSEDFGVDVQFPWETRPQKNHFVLLDIPDFWMDRYPVTNEQYHVFLRKSQYKPKELHNFLKHWTNRKFSELETDYTNISTWTVPSHLKESPVVYVSWEDAVAYAQFYNKRLPHDQELQYVMNNGKSYNLYPWGNNFEQSRLPQVDYSRNPPLPEPVGKHPMSQSVLFGVHDLVGLVWQMSDKTCDDHTCGLLVRGGSYYRPFASTLSDPNWYFPPAYRATEHNRLLMVSQSLDRAMTLGFRCVRDVN